MINKICSFCKKEMPANINFFYKCKNGGKFGLREKCKDCMKKINLKNKQERIKNGFPHWSTVKRRKDKAKELGISYESWCLILKLKKEIITNKKLLKKFKVRLNKFKPKKIIKKDFSKLKEYYQISNKSFLELTKDNPSEDTLIYRIRYKYDTEFNLKERLRSQLTKQQKKYPNLDYAVRQAASKNQNTKYLNILGYSKEELKNHLEKQFTKDMTWKAFRNGDIHIDHIKPQSLFDLKDINDVKECWSLKNLQPLWAKDNIAKSNKYKEK